jgi:hypothetical protein
MSAKKHKKTGGWVIRGFPRIGCMATGVGSSLSIMPRGTTLMHSYEADARALRGDVKIVGGDLYSSMKHGQEKSRRSKAAG